MAKQLTPQQIKALPLINVNYGDQKRNARYDENTKSAYFLDEEGNWNGTMAIYDFSEQLKKQRAIEQAAQTQSQESEAQELITADTLDENLSQSNLLDSSESTPESGTSDSDGQMPEEEETPPKKKKTGLFTILVVLLAAAIGISLWGSVRSKLQQNQPASTIATQATEAMNITEAVPTEAATPEKLQEPSEEAAPKIIVVAPKAALIPGTVLKEELFERIAVSESEYRQLSASTGLYTADELGAVESLVAVNYVPAGKYLSYTDIGREYMPVNPWEVDVAGSAEMKLAITPSAENLADYNWGHLIDLTITIQTKQTNYNADQNIDVTEPDGLAHESSVVESMVVDTYRLQGVKIKDLINNKNESLFTRYKSIAAIPSALQIEYLKTLYQTSAELQTEIPHIMVIALTQEQADILRQLDTEAMTVTISNATADNKTSLQNEVYSEIRTAETAIATVWKEILKEEAANERQQG